MQEYRLNEADLVIPDGWQDNTIKAFSAPVTNGGGSANFVITRDAKTGSPDVAAYADQHLVESAKKLKGYNLIGRRSQPVDGQPSITVDYTWSTPDRIEVQQRQAYVQHGAMFLIFTMSAKSVDFSRFEGEWNKFMAGVRIRNL
jgi:hypothetical protein